MTLLVVYGSFSILISFLCSLLEACLLSISRSYVETLVAHGARSGLALRKMKDNIDRPLAAILTLNTIAHTVGAAGVGGQAAIVFGSRAVGVASAIMTLLILVLSEIVPKTLGAVHAKHLAIPAAAVIRAMIVLCLPLIIPLEWLNRLIGYQRHQDRIDRAELLATIRLGQASGSLERREYQIASNLMALNAIRLSDVLTPRTVVFSLPESTTVGEVMQKHLPLRFARIPVFPRDPEHADAYVPRSAIYEAHAAGRDDKPLKELARPILYLPEQATVGHALDFLTRNNQQIAVVVDEFGGMAGIVTLEDLLETLLGIEIVDESDSVADMRELARKRRRPPIP